MNISSVSTICESLESRGTSVECPSRVCRVLGWSALRPPRQNGICTRLAARRRPLGEWPAPILLLSSGHVRPRPFAFADQTY